MDGKHWNNVKGTCFPPHFVAQVLQWSKYTQISMGTSPKDPDRQKWCHVLEWFSTALPKPSTIIVVNDMIYVINCHGLESWQSCHVPSFHNDRLKDLSESEWTMMSPKKTWKNGNSRISGRTYRLSCDLRAIFASKALNIEHFPASTACFINIASQCRHAFWVKSTSQKFMTASDR